MHVREAGIAAILRCHRVANFYYPSVVHTFVCFFSFHLRNWVLQGNSDVQKLRNCSLLMPLCLLMPF